MTCHRPFLSLSVFALICLCAGLLQAGPLEPVVTEAVINGPVDAVWAAFTTKQGIEKWMVAKTEIDLSIGGLWRTSHSKDSDLNDDRSIHHTVLAMDPERMLAFRTIKPPKDFPYPAITRTWTVAYFESAGPNKTRVVARMIGFEDNDQGRAMRAFFERGNRTQLDALVKLFESSAQR
jgi:uncharacterized protein YndB with AHSA1/START domain